MNKLSLLVALVAIAAASSGCTKRNAAVVESPSASATASASANMGDVVAKDIHDKLDKAKAAGKAVEASGKVNDDALKAATEEAPKPTN